MVRRTMQLGFFVAFFAFCAHAQDVRVSSGDIYLWGKVKNLIKKNFVGKIPSDNELLLAALKGMVNSLDDDYSLLLSERENQYYSLQESEVTFGRTGILTESNSEIFLVTGFEAGSPAFRAGLRVGDKIVAVDGKSVIGFSDTEFSLSLHGPVGSVVLLHVMRGGWGDTITIPITRAMLDDVSPSYRVVEQNIFYIKFPQFSPYDDSVFSNILDTLLVQYDESAQGFLILDLRGNRGGYLQIAERMLSNWLDSGMVFMRIHERENDGVYRIESVSHRDLSRFKTFILVDRLTASSSEIVIGALRDYKLAEVIGWESTYGKDVAQEIDDLENGWKLILTSAHWETASGFGVKGIGFIPDYCVEAVPEELRAHFDFQLEKAIELCRTEQTAFRETRGYVK